MMKNLTFMALLLILMGCANKNPEIRLPALISDNMVLQQNTKVNLWGWSDPKTKIKIKASWGATATVKSDTAGKWLASIETPKFGGPFTISIKAQQTEKLINNVMVGEVWLCSGQSNMEMPLRGWPPNDTINNSAQEIANAKYPDIRMFTVIKQPSIQPVDDCLGNWNVCSPETAGDFSATAFYFGLKIHRQLGIPVGLIHSSWGGTPAESWVGLKHIDKVPGFESFTKEIENATESIQAYNSFLSKLESIALADLPVLNPYRDLNLNDSTYTAANLDISNWKEMPIPSVWENAGLLGFDGVVWFIKDFEYDGSLYPEGFKLLLGPVDDMDATYLNGLKIGSNETEGVWNLEREYAIPANLLKKGINRIAVKVTDNRGGGGINGTKNPAIIKGTNLVVDLSGTWKFKPAATFYNNKIYVFGDGDKSYDAFGDNKFSIDAYTPTMLYNGMIAPLVNYTIQGAIWYQGESNVGRGKQYETLFPAMISNWREVWNQGDFPFYFVQIAPFNYGENANESTAELRDAQFKTLSLPNTGMVVTMDIGNPANIHPSNKLDIGERLALWALAKTYNQNDLVYSGPLFSKATFRGNVVDIEFDHAKNGLKFSTDTSFFEIAGSDAIFHPAQAIIAEEKIEVSSQMVQEPKQVRYGWTDDCEPNLFNTEGLPASPFKTPLN
jgi:sialate O-acetylesterase